MNRISLRTLATALALCAGGGTLLHAASPDSSFWVPLPAAASTVAQPIDDLFWMILWITGIAFLLVEIVLLVFLFKYRHKAGRKATYNHGNNTLEIIWTVVPALILVFIGVKSQALWNQMKYEFPTEDPKIEVVGQQFAWKIRYAGPDGMLGKTDAKFVNNDNTFGLNPDDAHGADDLFMDGVLILKMGEKIRIRIRSKDVLHSFFVPVFRFKQDAVPGMPTDVWVEPTLANYAAGAQIVDKLTNQKGFALTDDKGVQLERPRIWQIACAELCGNSHTNMKGTVYVTDNDADYNQLMTDNASKLWESTPPVVPDENFFKKSMPEAAPVDASAEPAAPVETATH